MKTLKYAIRFLMRAKSYTLINLLGLAFSLACSIILLRYLHRELTVDAHCVDRERTVVVLRDIGGNQNVSTTKFCDTTYISDHQIIRRTNLTLNSNETMIYENQEYFMNMIYADSSFLQMFNFQAVDGKLELSRPHDALISSDCAKRLFGNEHAVGKVLEYNWKHFDENNVGGTEKINITIVGVVKEPVCKTTLHFDILLSNQLEKYKGNMELIQVLPGVDLEAVNRVSNVYREFKHGDFQQRWEFLPLKDFYFNRPNNIRFLDVFFHFGSSDYLGILSIVAVLLLFVGILNFVNLYMVYMMKRQKEYGIKKVYGLQKLPLFLQIWVENVVLAFCALLVAWLFIEITQIPVARLMGTDMKYTIFDIYLSLAFLLGLPLITSVYPYIRYQYMSPITSMRSIVTNRQSVVARMLLLSVQYVITFVLVVFSLYLNKHFQFLLHTSPGFEYEDIMVADLIPEKQKDYHKPAVLGDKLNECVDIESWIQGDNILNDGILMKFVNDKDESTVVHMVDVSPKFLKVYGIELSDGEMPEIKGFVDKFIPNEAAMKAFGYKQLKDAFIRSERSLNVVYNEDGSIERKDNLLLPVKAVVKDYYVGHLTEGIKPMVFRVSSDGVSLSKFYIHIREGKEESVVQFLKKIVMEVYGTDEISYSWLSEQVEAIYEEDRQVATIYTVFALIAIAVSCLGLFGISLFDIRQRYREIGIRKVNGASMKDLYKLLFRKYVTILGIAFVIATPLAYYAIHVYTADFAIKASIGIDVFLISLLLVALISMGTLFWQIRKAANINPSIVMKRE